MLLLGVHDRVRAQQLEHRRAVEVPCQAQLVVAVGQIGHAPALARRCLGLATCAEIEAVVREALMGETRAARVDLG